MRGRCIKPDKNICRIVKVGAKIKNVHGIHAGRDLDGILAVNIGESGHLEAVGAGRDYVGVGEGAVVMGVMNRSGQRAVGAGLLGNYNV